MPHDPEHISGAAASQVRGEGVLAIETSNPSAWQPGDPMPGVCVGVRGAAGVDVVAMEPCDPASREDVLMLAIDRAVNRAGLAPRDLGTVAVSVGPGGFTAVRIAVTAARMIAQVAGASVVAVPTASVVAASVPPGTGPFAVALASKGEDAFVTRFDGAADPTVPSNGSVMDAAGLDRLGVELLIADAFLPASMREWALSRGVRIARPVFDPAMCLRVGVRLTPTDLLSFAPLYPREPEAVRKWRELHPGVAAGGQQPSSKSRTNSS